MAILPRYLFRLYLPTLILCLAACMGVLLMNQFLRLFSLALLKGISLWWILACFARLLPYFLSLAFPTAFLVALLLTLGQLSESGEVTAFRSAGYSFAGILWPYFMIALAFSLALFYVNHKASPEGFHSFRNRYEAAMRQVSRIDLEPGTFTEVGEWKLRANKVHQPGNNLGGVFLVKLKGQRQGMRVDAPEGRIRLEKDKGFWLELYHGTIQMPDPDPSRFLSATFGAYRILIPLFTPSSTERYLDLPELTTFQIFKRLREEHPDVGHQRELLTEIAVRCAGALTPFVFFWLGCPLGLSLHKSARTTGFALSLFVLFFYYGFLVVGIGLGRRHLALSTIAPGLPVAAGLIAGAYLWRDRLRQ